MLALATELLSTPSALDSEGMRAAACVLAAATVAVWAAVGLRTLHHLLTGTLELPPALL